MRACKVAGGTPDVSADGVWMLVPVVVISCEWIGLAMAGFWVHLDREILCLLSMPGYINFGSWIVLVLRTGD